jgi:geranylgeranyl transferase type-2 subunit beta
MATTTPIKLHPLLSKTHIQYLYDLRDDKKQSEKLGHWMSSHLRVSGIYWGLGALRLLDSAKTSKPQEQIESEKCEEEKLIQFCLACHLLYTLSAVQILTMLGAENRMKSKDKTAAWVAGLQNKQDGSFVGDRWGEVDTRFSYSALNCLALLGKLDLVDMDSAVAFVKRCQNWDGGFGVTPSAESHAGQIFCCIGALSIAQRLHEIDRDRVAWWLAERQLPSGGLNGRPEKKADVCYSWWVLSSLSMLNRIDWIDRDALVRFVLLCQDEEDGGISDKPGNQPDVYHTFFGAAGLSLLKWTGGSSNEETVVVDPAADLKLPLPEIDPTFAMPPSTLERLGIEKRGLKN